MRTVVIIADSHYKCIGTSMSCFSDDGKCTDPELPWASFRDFAMADQIAEPLSDLDFYDNVDRKSVV